MTRGILYIAWLGESGNRHVFERLRKSIHSLRRFCDLPITIRTNAEKEDRDFLKFSFEDVHFKEVVIANTKKFKFKAKLEGFSDLPYDITIFCDTDTVFYDDPEKIIDEEVDLSICRQQDWTRYKRNEERMLDKHINTGFFIAKNSKPFKNLIRRAWKEAEAYESNESLSDPQGDQNFINAAINFSFDITMKILPQQWNVNEAIFESVENAKLIHTKCERLNTYRLI